MPIAEAYDLFRGIRMGGPEIPFYIARENKLYSNSSLRDDFEYGNANEILAQIKKEQEIVGVLPVNIAINEMVQNKKIVIFAAVFQGWDYSIWGKEHIKKLEDLSNKRIAVQAEPNLQRLVPYVAFSKVLVDPAYLKLTLIEKPPQGVYKTTDWSAFDAIVIRTPDEKIARASGLKKIYDLSGFEERIPNTVMVASRNYILRKYENVRLLIKVIRDSIKYGKENEKKTKEIIRKYYKIDDNQVIDSFYDVYVKKGLDIDIRPIQEKWERLYYPVLKTKLFEWPGIDTIVDKDVLEKLYN
jgi:ABC-type nitrate/sulfonate/bicarbonate transport system substrate-binding protein